MKKKILILVLLTVMSFCFGCSAQSNSENANNDNSSSLNNASTNSIQEDDKTQNIDLEALLNAQPLSIIDTEYVIQSDDYKTLYPDMLQVILSNNTETDIKSAVIAFVAWDENNLPIKIEGQFDFNGGSYVKKVNYNDINLASGQTFGDGYGFSISENCKISTFKAIAVSYETFEGESWKNPYYKDFCDLYEGQKLNQ